MSNDNLVELADAAAAINCVSVKVVSSSKFDEDIAECL
jgi:hypothetical protein